MFWFRTSAVRNIFCCGLNIRDFEKENGSLDGLLAHAVERSWFYICVENGYTWLYYNEKNYKMTLSETIMYYISKMRRFAQLYIFER